MASDQPQYSRGQIFLNAFETSDCTGLSTILGSVTQQQFDTWDLLSETVFTTATTASVYITLAIQKGDDAMGDVDVSFDDIYLAQTSEPVFAIGAWMSAIYYDPLQSGHGIMLNMLTQKQAFVCWYTFDLDGNRTWICGLGRLEGNSLVFANAYVVEGGNFPPMFDPEAISEVPWGEITITFTGCNSGLMEWTTLAEGYLSGSMPLARLVSLLDNQCPTAAATVTR